MKVGILTFHRANNYGAVLQCYAFQQYLRALGLDVEVIDYRQPIIEKAYRVFSITKFFKLLLHPVGAAQYIVGIPRRLKRSYEFKKFRKNYISISPRPFFGKGQLDYDIVFHGSDQIWNPKLLGGKMDDIYLGFYKLKANADKVAYAVSFEDKSISNDVIKKFQEGLNNFSAISLREESLVKHLVPLTDKKINIVVDPTLLLSRNDFDQIATYKKMKKKYVLLYAVGPMTLALKLAKRIAFERNLNLINITNKDISPSLFIGYIKQAEFVVSVSFHGTVFSLLYNKNFYTIATGMASDVRYYDLLRNFHMEDRCITYMPEQITAIDYSDFNLLKYKYVQPSINFIKDCCLSIQDK